MWRRVGFGLVTLVAIIAAFVTGLFVYMNATARPLHPDPIRIPSRASETPSADWAGAADAGRQILRSALSAQNLPGASVAVAIDGRIVWTEGFGFADLDKQVPITPNTRFRIGNVSIPLTSVAVGLLLEQHRLKLDSDIQAYVSEFPEKQWPVTLRHLMADVAGLPDDAGDEEPISMHCQRTLDALPRFRDRPLLFEPGTRFRPSSYGWILVSAAVEAAGNQPFPAFMRAHILDPLGMTGTTLDSSVDEITDRTTFYFPRFAADPRYGPDLVREGDYSCFTGATGFLSTPTDLVRFGAALQRGSLLQRGTIDMLQSPQRLESGEETGYGLGWKLETVALGGRPTRLVSRSSKRDFMGGTTSLMMFPERSLVLAVTSNISFADTHPIALRIAQAFAERQQSRD